MSAEPGSSSGFSFDRLTDILAQSLVIYRNHFVSFITLVGVLVVPLTLITTSLSAALNDDLVERFNTPQAFGTTPALPVGFWPLVIISLLAAFLQGVVINGLITYVTSESLFGRRITLIEAYAESQGRLWQLALGLLVFGVIYVLAFFLVAFLGVLCLVPLFGLPVIGYLYLATYFYVVPVMMLENVTPSLGISRALALGKSRFWMTFALFFILTLLSAVISSLFVGLARFISGGDLSTADLQFDPLYVFASLIVTVVVTPLIPIGLTVIYYDTRNQVERLQSLLTASGVPDARPKDVVSPQPQGRLITGEDIGNVVLLVLVFIGFAVLLSILGLTLVNLFI
ncbi:MAG: hypothetical protein OHK0046_42340 [Anaerolineae bacterium]